MWAKVAEELAVPWRAAEAMHWQLGEADMARRAGVVPFSLAAVNVESGHRIAPPRANIHFQPPDTVSRHMTPPSPRAIYARNPPPPPPPVSAMTVAGQMPRGENVGAPPVPPPLAGTGPIHGSVTEQHGEFYYSPGPVGPGPGLAPIQHQGQPRNPGPLPSLAELTTGVSPYAPQLERPHSGHMTPVPKHGMSIQTPPGYQQHVDSTRVKRRASPEMMQREGSHRRRLG